MKEFTRILTLGSLSSHRQGTKYACPRFHTLLAALLLMPCFAIAQGQASGAPHPNQPTASPAQPILSFTAPAPATVSTDGTVTATLHLSGNADSSTLRVMLNNSDVTSWFSPSKCSAVPCDLTAQLNFSAGVNPGWDSLYATLKGDTGNAGIAKARFYYGNGVPNSANGSAVAHAMDVPSSRASVHPAAITAGTSATLPVLPSTIAISMDPTAGLTLGSTNYPACGSGTPFSFFRFDRTSLQLEDQECLTPAILPQLIVGLQGLDNTSIVFLFSAPGTPLGKLNFSTIGGTDFTQSSAPTVSSYQFVGYGAASPGQAFESYQDAASPNFNLADITGNLVNTGASNAFYGFQPTDAPAFVALSNLDSGYSITVTGYPQTFPFGSTTPTNWSVPSNFTQQKQFIGSQYPANTSGFLVVMFSPTDFSVLSQQFYATGTNLGALETLSGDLNAATNGTIIVITSQGSNPFGSVALGGPTPTLASFCGAVSLMGVSQHACAQAGAGGTGEFSMVGVMEQSSGSAIASGVYSKWYSSTYETGQNDSGSLKGLFTRDHHFHLVPDQVSSYDTSTIAQGAAIDSLFGFALPTQVVSAPAVTWPMLDTPGHQAAYAYLSNAIVGKVLFGNGTCTVDAAWCNDVRAWYAGSEVQAFAGLDLSASPSYAFPTSAVGFSQSDFNDVKNQLQAELVYLSNELNYESWFRSVTNGTLLNTGSAFSAAANEINGSLITQYATIQPPPVSLTAGLVGFAGDLTAAMGAVPGLKDLEEAAVEAGPVISVATATLKLASGAISVFSSHSGSGTDPSVVQVGDLITTVDGQANLAAAKYNLALQEQVGNQFADVRSDWFKLQTYGILTSQPSANGWYIQNTGGTTATILAALSTARARVSLYSQLLPKYFVMDWMFAIPVQGIVNTNQISLSDLNSQYIASYLTSQYSSGYGGTWPPPDFAQFSLPNTVNSTCQDYGLVASQYSLSHLSGTSFLSSWQNSLGDVLMGPPSSADGLGNLNLSQNTFYDLELTTIPSPTLNTNLYAPNQFASLPWGQNISCPTSATVSAPAPGPAPVSSGPGFRTLLTAVPSATRVAPQGSITVAASVQPADSTVTLAPTGAISIASGTRIISTKSLTQGTSAAATSTLTLLAGHLSPGTYSLTVGYGGDNNFVGSAATINLQVLAEAAATTTTLTIPPVAYQGQNLTLQTTVSSTAGVPHGTVSFQDGTISLGSAPLDSSGNASITLNNLGLGNHTITAVYSPTDNLTYAASQSQTTTLLINPIVQDMAVSLSASSVDVPDGAQSTPVKFTVSSVSAFAGQVSFACVGLPLGMTCNFSPSQGGLPASGVLSTNLTIGQSATSSAGLTSGKGCVGLFGFLISALLAFRISRGRQLVGGAVWMWALIVLSVVSLSGCSSGNGTSSNTTRQTGTTNIFVTATSGNITRNVPLTVNIR